MGANLHLPKEEPGQINNNSECLRGFRKNEYRAHGYRKTDLVQLARTSRCKQSTTIAA